LAQLGLTFWTPLSNSSAAAQSLEDVEYKPHVKLGSLLEMYKYFPRLNSVALPEMPSVSRRRGSHMSPISQGSGSGSSSSAICVPGAGHGYHHHHHQQHQENWKRVQEFKVQLLAGGARKHGESRYLPLN